PNRSSTEYAEINAPSIYNTCDKIIKDFHTNSPWPAGIWSYSLDGKFYLFEDGTGEYYNKTNSHLNRNITWKVEGNILKIEKKFNTWFEILESDNSFMEKSDTAICRIIQVCKKEFSSSDNSYKYEFSYDMTEQKILHGKYFYHTWLYSHDKATVNITEWKGRKFFEKQIVLEYLGPVVCSKYK
ncbi:MAG TPA: hypothetical protein PKW80_06695, partial [Bacteroidales bacterium]|nr:hypothetical protein [Bacteroidales bacterium]